MGTRANRILAAAVAGLLVIAVVAVVVSATRPRAQFEEGSPEAAVQSYLEAVWAGDGQGALEHLEPDTGCTATDLEQGYVDDRARVVLRDSRRDGDTAVIEVELVRSGGGPFGGDEWSETETFRLVEGAAGWLITGSPWPAFGCTGKGSEP